MRVLTSGKVNGLPSRATVSYTTSSRALRALKIARALFGCVVVWIRLRPSAKPSAWGVIVVVSCFFIGLPPRPVDFWCRSAQRRCRLPAMPDVGTPESGNIDDGAVSCHNTGWAAIEQMLS